MNGQCFLFPFESVPKGCKVIIYGMGIAGKQYLLQLHSSKYCEVVMTVDRNWAEFGSYMGFDIVSPKKIENTEYDVIVIAGATRFATESIYSDLLSAGCNAEKIICSQKEPLVFPDNMLIYSQYGEDIIVKNIFDFIGINKPSYIDIGAHHPIHLSNTALLYLNGSRGINVEANPQLIGAFNQHRPEDQNLNIGVSNKCGTSKFYVFHETSGLNTFSAEFANDCVANDPRNTISNIVEIPVTTIPDIINQHHNGIYPDYLSIDIEGWDFFALTICDFSNGKPYVITAECDKGFSGFNELLSAKGFIPYARSGGNITFVRKELLGKLFS